MKRTYRKRERLSLFVSVLLLSTGVPAYANLVLKRPARTPAESCKLAYDKLLILARLKTENKSPSPHPLVTASELKLAAKGSTGLTLEDLRSAGIPEEMFPYYNLKTGEFNYKSEIPVKLASENGDAKLKAIRINWDSVSTEIPLQYLKELVPLMRKTPGMEIWVVGGKEDQALTNAIADLPRDVRSRIKRVDGKPGNVWAQDASKPLAHGSVTLKPPGLAEGREVDKYFAPIRSLNEAGLAETLHSPFRFEGGNVVVGEKNVFVGPDVISAAVKDYKISRQEALAALSSEFGKPVVEVADHENTLDPQIDYHLDLTMAVVRNRKNGKETVLVASTKKAAELLTKTFEESGTEPSSLKDLGKGSNASGPVRKGEKNLSDLFAEMNQRKFEEREKQLDRVAQQMKDLGYDVERVPDISASKLEPRKDPYPKIFNYTNIILSGDVALVPKMEVKQFDDSIKQTLENLGYDIVPIGVARESVCIHGGIRCLSETYRLPALPAKTSP